MKFGDLTYLLLLWAVPALILFYIFAFRRRDRFMRLFCEEGLIKRVMPNISRSRQKLKAVLIIFAVIFVVIALIRPRWGYEWEEVKQRGVEIVVALDVSNSMLAEDVPPNRLRRARMELEDLLKILKGDRIGLVAFAGDSFLQCPLTLDYGAFMMFLDYIDTDLIEVQGTSLGKAINSSIKAFDPKSGKSKAIILITDGEDNSGEALKAAEEAKKAGIKIFAIGIGSEEGSPIPDKKTGGFKKDSNNEIIMTKLDEPTLVQIALITGGGYARSVTGDMDLEKIYTEGIKKELKDEELMTDKRKRYVERFQIFAGLALLLVVLESLISDKRTA